MRDTNSRTADKDGPARLEDGGGRRTNRNRRRFLLGGLALGGTLVVGWGIAPPRQRLRASKALALESGAVALNGWVAIATDGTVSVVVPRSEMGQGVSTALPMLLAE